MPPSDAEALSNGEIQVGSLTRCCALCISMHSIDQTAESWRHRTLGCLPVLELFSVVSLCSFARLWGQMIDQPSWLDSCNLWSGLATKCQSCSLLR